ncbi:uncharacterized protein DC041_0010663 [Schistosoma bovis]|uniref:Uncharacterized protein n=1 Tax=Schistosoma bovis TaxID=6184 RepID=A0A430QB32_SCHBO|nr:uncharacterized protein DC041_0010663 [Schistosoma bovis]
MIHVFSNASQLYGVLGKQLSQPKLVKEAIEQAVSDAKHKAELIASAFGQRIQGLINVIEDECDVTDEQLQITTPRSNNFNDYYQLKQPNDKNNIDSGVGQSYERPFDWKKHGSGVHTGKTLRIVKWNFEEWLVIFIQKDYSNVKKEQNKLKYERRQNSDWTKNKIDETTEKQKINFVIIDKNKGYVLEKVKILLS